MVRLIHLMPLALEVCVNDRACWRNVPLPFWRYELRGCELLKKRLFCRDLVVLEEALWVEQVPCLAKIGHGIGGILGVQAGGMGK